MPRRRARGRRAVVLCSAFPVTHLPRVLLVAVLQKLQGPAAADGAAAAGLQHRLRPEGQQEEAARAEDHAAGHGPAGAGRPEQGAGRAVAEGNAVGAASGPLSGLCLCLHSYCFSGAHTHGSPAWFGF